MGIYISGVISPRTWVTSIVTLLITLLITTHEPPSTNLHKPRQALQPPLLLGLYGVLLLQKLGPRGGPYSLVSGVQVPL